MYKVGVDLGGTNIVAGVINDNYEIIGRAKVKTNVPRPAKEIMDDIVYCVKKAAEDAEIAIDEISSIGVGTPGSVDREKGIIEFANNLYFHHVPAAEMIRSQIDVPVYLENDANCAALGEAVAGCGKGKKEFVAITLGTGVGSGYIHDGKIVIGCNGAGGEFGHMVIDIGGEKCTCGREGCWESYASATALVRQTKAAMLENPGSKMWQLTDGDINNVSGRTAFDGMREGDIVAESVVEKYIKYIAVGTINVINALQPDMICFGGGICNEGETLLSRIRKHINEFRYSRYADTQTEICRAKLGNDAGIIGAALVEN
ncbi:MAG: ROK family protein [Faecalibacterium sp.]|nr:ROK family protein [Ruminococcus sp.]MCM1391608.1 ROK family protein [Ruminococcus sp.]MCM1485020.1 ROK family protein [Faecalibacterium sp.]